jgi:galactoside O-acetyltransferase
MKTSFYSEAELKEIGFKKIGKNIQISRKASIYTPELICIGSHVRIDDFCILSGEITIGSHIHISAYTALYGKYGILIDDFVTISGRVMVYSQNDDYSGDYLTNPTIPTQYTNITGGTVHFKKHSIVAAGSIILPATTLGVGACLGGMSMLKTSIPDWEIYVGVPAKKKGIRSQKLLEAEILVLQNEI